MLKDVSLTHALYVVLNVGQLADLRLQHAVGVRGVQGDVDGGNIILLVHSITTLVESPRKNIDLTRVYFFQLNFKRNKRIKARPLLTINVSGVGQLSMCEKIRIDCFEEDKNAQSNMS